MRLRSAVAVRELHHNQVESASQGWAELDDGSVNNIRPEQIGAVLVLIAGIIASILVAEPAGATSAAAPSHPAVHPVITKQRHLSPQIPGHVEDKHIDVDEVPIPSPPSGFVGQQQPIRARYLPARQPRGRIYQTAVPPVRQSPPPQIITTRRSMSAYMQAMHQAGRRSQPTAVPPPTGPQPTHSPAALRPTA